VGIPRSSHRGAKVGGEVRCTVAAEATLVHGGVVTVTVWVR